MGHREEQSVRITVLEHDWLEKGPQNCLCFHKSGNYKGCVHI